MSVDKNALKKRLIELEQNELDHAVEHYDEYMRDSQLASNEPHDTSEYATARFNADLADAFDHPVLEHQHKMDLIESTDFGPKDVVERGAAVMFGGKNFVVVTSTRRFEVDGTEYMGISIQSPVFKAMEGLSAGESFTLGDREITIEAVS